MMLIAIYDCSECVQSLENLQQVVAVYQILCLGEFVLLFASVKIIRPKTQKDLEELCVLMMNPLYRKSVCYGDFSIAILFETFVLSIN